MKNFINRIGKFLEKLSDDHVGEYTAQCAYFTFLSFIPFIILLLSLIKYMNIERDNLVYILQAVLPTVTQNSVMDIIQEVYSKSFQTVSISAIFTLWSAGNSFYSLSLGLSSIYKSEKGKNYLFLRLKGIIGTIVIILSIIIALILLVFGNIIKGIIEEKFVNFSNVVGFVLNFRSFIVVIALFFMFLLLYRFVPGKKGLTLLKQIPGAVFASVGWIAVSYFFSIYVDIFKNFSVIYGSLATIILIMMWLYAIIYIILLGAEINVLFSKFNILKIKTQNKN